MSSENISNSPSGLPQFRKSCFSLRNSPSIIEPNNDEKNQIIENDNATPNKIQRNFSELIITKGWVSQNSIVSFSNPLMKKNLLQSNLGNLYPNVAISKLEDEENNSITKIEEEGTVLKLNRNSTLQSVENHLEIKSKKKFSSDYFQERQRPGYPTLTQKKRDLAPLLELEGIESNSFKESDLPQDELFTNTHKSGKKPNYIISELENIEKLKTYKTKMERFVILFNNKPQDGITYLIDNKIKTTKEDIANILLTYEGLSKEILGQYFGSPDSYIQEIFNHFCSFLDFSKLELDQALRLLLSRFRLPGEAQQIDRIVQTFSQKYMLDNPQAFNDEDTPYILSYSAIMLSTDAHSANIQHKNKMKKHQFVENNKKICPSVSLEFLEGMYNRIVSQKFETKTDCFYFI